jgi:hypothetical protein
MKKLITPKKIKKLAEKALKDKPDWKPSKGHQYLKDLEPGDFFTTGNLTGVLLECDTNAKVIITDSNKDQAAGKIIIGAETEVIKL